MAVTEKDIPIAIKRKIDSIYKHQIAVKRLTAQVEDYFLVANPQIDELSLEGETWRMCIDRQGTVATPIETLNLLLKALNAS